SSAEPRPRGVGGRPADRRPPTLFNRAYGKAFFWDGRAATLEEQALKPIENPAEMGSSVAAAVDRLRADAAYKARFAAAFDDGGVKSLEDVVEFYNRGGVVNPHLDPAMRPLDLTKDELRDLVAFLKSL